MRLAANRPVSALGRNTSLAHLLLDGFWAGAEIADAAFSWYKACGGSRPWERAMNSGWAPGREGKAGAGGTSGDPPKRRQRGLVRQVGPRGGDFQRR